MLLLVSIAVSFSPVALFSLSQSQSGDNAIYAVISIDGEEVDRFLLSGNEEHKLITYQPTPNQYNIVEIDGDESAINKLIGPNAF